MKHIKILQDNTKTETVTAEDINKLYEYCKNGNDSPSAITGKLYSDYAYDEDCKYLTEKYHDLSIMIKDYYATIKDADIRKTIVAKYGMSDGKHVLVSSLASVGSLESLLITTSAEVDAGFLSYFKKVTNIKSAFANSTSLRKIINLDNFYTSSLYDCSYAFDGCVNLENVGGIDKWNVPYAADFTYMFRNCRSLKTIDLSHWNVKSCINMGGMFYGCSNLTYIDLSNWDVTTAKSMDQMFAGCSSLVELNLSHWTKANFGWTYNGFANCNKLSIVRMDGCTDDAINVMKERTFAPIYHDGKKWIYTNNQWQDVDQ